MKIKTIARTRLSENPIPVRRALRSIIGVMGGIQHHSEDECLTALVATAKDIARGHATEFLLMAQFGRLNMDEHGVVDEFACAEIATELRITPRGASGRLQDAMEIQKRLPASLMALTEGLIDRGKLMIIYNYTDPLDEAKTAVAERELLERAPDMTHGQLRALAKRVLKRVDPDGELARHEVAKASRRVVKYDDEHGMATLHAYLPAHVATQIYTRVDDLARHLADDPDDKRTMDERRADVYADLILNPAGYATSTVQTQVLVTVAASTLMGLDNKPAELGGYGPIDAAIAREMASDATWQRLVTDPLDGTLINYGTTRYRPPKHMADFVRARNRTCSFPGCRHPSRRCDLDHTVPFPKGETCEANLTPLCRFHHRLKTEGTWHVINNGRGCLTWISPHGRKYDTAPEPLIDPRPASASVSVAVSVSDDPAPF